MLKARNRVEELMEQMTLSEKIGQLNLVTPGGDTLTGTVTNGDVANKVKSGAIGGIFGIKSLSAVRAFQDLAMQSPLRIPLMFAEDVIHGHRTIFPVPLGLSGTWNMDLIEKAAAVSAREASAEGIDQVYAPMIDVSRDPRWGRIAESPGEDPFLASEYTRAFVNGLQGKDLGDKRAVMSCLKHFVAYGGAEGGRDYDSVDVSARRLHDIYMPPFVAGIKAGAGSMMASFNTVNGTPMHAHGDLIHGVLRRIYAFSGLMVSDYTGVLELVNHRIAAHGAEAARLGLEAGVESDMVSELFLTTLEESVKNGLIDISHIDNACRHVLEAKEKLGLFDNPYLRMSAKPFAFRPAHKQLARQTATEACVLLKNDHSCLPLKQGAKIALIGPLANDRINMNGTWAVSGNP
ncbi:MAG: beta-glucosidase, partial [Micavibrio aeruginosavorus]